MAGKQAANVLSDGAKLHYWPYVRFEGFKAVKIQDVVF
jgi:hypothetical protein